jgi:hypothetical protein
MALLSVIGTVAQENKTRRRPAQASIQTTPLYGLLKMLDRAMGSNPPFVHLFGGWGTNRI